MTKKTEGSFFDRWSTTADIYKEDTRRGAQATVDLHNAYAEVFDRTRPGVDVVLGDLAEFSGYFFTAPRGSSEADLNRMEGMREVFARILNLIALPMPQLEALRLAAIEEQRISNEEARSR